MQLSIVEFARNVIGYDDAHSVELNPNTTHPVIHSMAKSLYMNVTDTDMKLIMITEKFLLRMV